MVYKYNVIKIADRYFDDYKLVSSGRELTTSCFFCYPKSVKKKLAINVDTGLYHCWKCGKKGNIIQLIVELKKLNKKIDLSNFKTENKNTLTKYKDVPTTESIPWPEGFFFLDEKATNPKAQEARAYLASRGIDNNLISIYQIGYASFGMYANRVIVPIFYKGNLVAFIARDWTGTSDKRILTPAGHGTTGIKRYIYRMEEASKLGHLIITEGVFSAISCGPRAIALFGKEATKGQLAQIIAAQPKRVTVFLDPDAKKEAINLSRTLTLYFTDVRLALLPDGMDPNSAPKDLVEKAIKEAKKITTKDILEIDI